MKAINRGFFISAAISAAAVFVISAVYMDDLRPAVAVLLGLVLASVIQILTQYFTDTKYKPVQEIAESTQTGPATTILSGFSVGLESTAPPRRGPSSRSSVRASDLATVADPFACALNGVESTHYRPDSGNGARRSPPLSTRHRHRTARSRRGSGPRADAGRRPPTDHAGPRPGNHADPAGSTGC